MATYDESLALYQLPHEVAKAVADALKGAGIGKEEGKGVGGFAADWSVGMTMPRMRGLLEPVMGTVKQFVAGFQAAMAPFSEVTEVASHFVSAINPALVSDLAMHFRNLNAVLGVAL